MAASGEPQPLISAASGPLRGDARIPGDKSVSHRALIFGAMTIGETRISGLLEGQDVLDTAKAMRAFGAEVERTGDTPGGGGDWVVRGVGVGALREPETVIDCGNAGTGVRLIMGAAAGCPITVTFTGDASLRGRPMGRVLEPLKLFGATSMGRTGGRLPLTLRGADNPVPVDYDSPVASAQVKSAVLLAGLGAPGVTTVIERVATRDHTERMLRGFGASVSVEPVTTTDGAKATAIRLTGQPDLTPTVIATPRDPSSAAFPICAALIVPGSDVRAAGVSLNPTRAGLYATLREMGADLTFENEREEGGEPVADLRARFSGDLRGIEVPPERAASMIDEYPILSVVAAFATGSTVMRGVHELRVKESDRIAAMATGLRACGVQVDETEDSMTAHGRGADGVDGGATGIATHLDHRIAMSFLILGMATRRPVGVDDGGAVATSFPDFLRLMRGLGADITAA